MMNFIKIFIYKIIPSRIYYQIAFYVKKNRLKKYQNLINSNSDPKIIFNFLKTENRKKIFIFGSGSSINELSDINYKEISQNFSIGLNNWVFHDFKTDLYLIELGPDESYNEKVKLRILSLLKNKLINSIFLVYISYTSSPNQTFKNRGITNLEKIKNWMNGMDPNRVFLYEYLRPDIFKKNISNQFLKTLKFLSKNINKSNVLTLGIGASLERAISLCILLGYSKIILLGVDLINTKVFWSNKDINYKDIKNEQKTYGLHKTATDISGRVPVQKSVLTLDKIARQHFNSRILISTNKSLLSSKLERYKWQNI